MSAADNAEELWDSLMKGELEPRHDITSADVNRAARAKAEETWGASSHVKL